MSYSELACNVHSRFIGCNHALLKHCRRSARRYLGSDTVRALMHIEKIANAVACTMLVVHAVSPKRFTRDVVKILPSCAVQELCICKVKMTLENKCKHLLLLIRKLTKSHCSCYIGCSLIVMSACICKKEASSFKLGIRLLRR